MSIFEYKVNFLDDNGYIDHAETFGVEAEDNEEAMELILEECGDEYELEFILKDVR